MIATGSPKTAATVSGPSSSIAVRIASAASSSLVPSGGVTFTVPGTSG
jgi:hypothetical protein